MFIPTVAVRLYRPVALALEAEGIDAARVFAEFDMPDPATTGWDVRLPLPQLAGVWGRLLEVTGDPQFALRAAEYVDLTVCDVITFLEGNAKTVRTALEAKFKFLPLITNAVEWTLETSDDEARVTLFERPPRPPLAPVAEYLLGTRNVFFRRFGPKAWGLRDVSFRHAAPPNVALYQQVFGVVPRFDAALDQLVFDRSLLDAPMQNRDDALTELLSRYAEPALAKADQPATLSGRIEALLSSGVDPGVVSIAERLGVAPRTLQRTLSNEGTTYAEIATRMKRAAAERLLRRRELAIAEVAYALDFSDASAFHHAFVRWTGVTPGEFRARNLGDLFSEPNHGRLGPRSAAE
ncbi:MAG TPA: AraC family transcriptional regulator ligand-binding domain-containing protein [Polyangiaceae bacterium]|nr:AraC family transcriptional regulator ligand-binding domain-containing protein [Polyangiaceae bacterium]